MSPSVSWKRRLLSVAFWSIISAAFIGPGTVTTAGKAGAAHGLDLLWALLFSILATIVLQEAAARITLASDRSLGEIISLQFANARWLRIALFLAVAFGCAAYQAGNLLGALSGLELLGDIHYYGAILLLGSIAFMLLWWGNIRHISTFLALIVAGMGLTFFWVALQSPVSLQEVVTHSFQVQFPKGSSLLIIGLIGTTIVPYNLFLASGISHSQSLGEMRWGLITSILLGGIISAAVVVVGTEITGTFSFPALATALSERLGSWGGTFFGLGLFVAGLSSAITAPLAASIAAQTLLGNRMTPAWKSTGRYYRATWMVVLGIGLLFGILNVKPIPAIILAQALNGLLLPVVAAFLFLAINNRKLLGKQVNGRFANLLLLLIVGVATFLGTHHLLSALQKVVPDLISITLSTWIKGVVSLLLLLALATRISWKSTKKS
jgi:manganese transport protein